MQQFCREICKANGVRERPANSLELVPPASWPVFFRNQLEEASANWATKLLRGLLERGSPRTKYQTKAGLELDGYGLALAAIAETGPELSISKDKIRAGIAEMIEGTPPGSAQTTNVLKNMSRIAKQRLTDPSPVEEEGSVADSISDVQPVLDYVDDGPTSAVHIADPFFAFYLAWGMQAQLEAIGREQDSDGVIATS